MTAVSTSRTPKPPTYVERLLADLDDIHAEYGKILAMSAIVNKPATAPPTPSWIAVVTCARPHGTRSGPRRQTSA